MNCKVGRASRLPRVGEAYGKFAFPLSLSMNRLVAQAASLLYRRLPVGGAWNKTQALLLILLFIEERFLLSAVHSAINSNLRSIAMRAVLNSPGFSSISQWPTPAISLESVFGDSERT